MVKVIKSWETVYFRAEKKGNSATVELNLNRENKTFTLNTSHQEAVSFKGDSVEDAELRAEAVVAAVKYVKSVLNEKQGKKKKRSV